MTSYILVSIILATAGVGVLAGLAVLAHRQHLRITGPEPGGATDVLDRVDDLALRVEAVGAVAQEARAVADEARQRAAFAEHDRDRAEAHYRHARFALRRPDPDAPQRLVERAALTAYRKGQISAAQLDAIWRQTAPGEPPPQAAGEEDVHAAQDRLARAAAAAERARLRAEVAAQAANALAVEERNTEADLVMARQSASGGLPGLLGD